MILLGGCLEKLGEMEANSIDAVVTDPPYGLSFMNKKWDYNVPSVEVWREVIRVLKPGGHLLSFGGTRTYHRMVVNIEDAGFEIRDQIQWLYGSGFPKSLDISKAIDKQAGVGREVIATIKKAHISQANTNEGWARPSHLNEDGTHKTTMDITAPATDDAKKWQGFGTALKPANEPIVLARKPLEKGLTVAENVLKWGVGGLNIDATRIGTEIRKNNIKDLTAMHKGQYGNGGYLPTVGTVEVQGRFPANLILDETAAEMLDEQSGTSKSGVRPPTGKPKYTGSTTENSNAMCASSTLDTTLRGHSDSGGASRFFYCAKSSKSERNAGLTNQTPQVVSDGREKSIDNPFLRGETERLNTHPTVKPIKLMRYLCRLVTPPNGTILDPFMGSGSTGIAAQEENFKFIGIEIDPAYYEIARNRIEGKP